MHTTQRYAVRQRGVHTQVPIPEPHTRCCAVPHTSVSCQAAVQHQSGSHHHIHQCHSSKCGCNAEARAPLINVNRILHGSALGTLGTALEGAAAHAQDTAQVLTGAASDLAGQTLPGVMEGAKYVPSPYQPGWEIWVGFLAGVIPFAIGSWEFGKRIIIQQRCELCGGSGLVPSTNSTAKYLRKCPECGGFFPWISWKMFLTSNATPGNGGPLQQPKGQTSVFYEVPAAMPAREQMEKARSQYMTQGAAQGVKDGEQVPEPASTAPEHQNKL